MQRMSIKSTSLFIQMTSIQSTRPSMRGWPYYINGTLINDFVIDELQWSERPIMSQLNLHFVDESH